MLSEIAKYHSSWVSTVKAHGEKEFAEDIVQEMYLKVHKYTDPKKIFSSDGKLKKGYIFFVLKSILFTFKNGKNKIKKTSLDAVAYKMIDEPNFYDSAYEVFINKMDNEIESWHWYDAQMFNLYKSEYKRELSLRKIAKATDISWVSIHNTIKRCREKLVDKLQEDWEDLQNGDYELLNK